MYLLCDIAIPLLDSNTLGCSTDNCSIIYNNQKVETTKYPSTNQFFWNVV